MRRRGSQVGRTRRAQITREARRMCALGRTDGWTIDQLQDELLRRFRGELFAGEARMYAYGWSVSFVRDALQALAEREGLDASGLQDIDVVRWLRGEVYPRDALDRLCELFQCHQARLGWPDDPSRSQRDDLGVVPTNRREAVKAIALLGAGAGLDWMAVEAGGGSRRRVDRRLLAAYEQVAEALAGLYRGVDPHAVLPAAIPVADDLLSMLHSPMPDRERTELVELVAGVNAQVGLWACHIGRWPLAYRSLATACDVAAGGSDRALRARSLGALSYLFSSAPRGGHGGDPARALSLLNEALELAAGADGFTRGWLATWRADQHATLGNLETARADIDTADRDLGAGDSSQIQGFFARANYGYGMNGHLDSVRAVVLALHGERQESDRTFEAVQSSAANSRRQVASLAHLALVRSSARDPEAACDALDRSITLAAQEDYTMGLERAGGVRAGFDPTWSTLSCVRDLDERLHLLAG